MPTKENCCYLGRSQCRCRPQRSNWTLLNNGPFVRVRVTCVLAVTSPGRPSTLLRLHQEWPPSGGSISLLSEEQSARRGYNYVSLHHEGFRRALLTFFCPYYSVRPGLGRSGTLLIPYSLIPTHFKVFFLFSPGRPGTFPMPSLTSDVSLLQGKSVSLTNFFRIARNTMTMCFNKEPGAAEVEVSVLMSASAVGVYLSAEHFWRCETCIGLILPLHFVLSARVLENRGAEGLPRGSALWEG